MDIKDVLMGNYLPYAAEVIVDRAIPEIDGLKPSARRILYSMYDFGLMKGDRRKSTIIVGNTMKWHPHGDSSIYETAVRMAESHEALNVAYIDDKGNFGKSWSGEPDYAASRYTEMKLTEICKELFEGLEEGAVEMVPNFDNTETEPLLLPVKFPSIIVNPSSGIAVGKSSNIPPFGLKQVCKATIGLIEGSITNTDELMDVLEGPEYPTGGAVYLNKEELRGLVERGKGSLYLGSTAELYKDSIIIREIPYRSSVLGIKKEITELLKTELKEVTLVEDLTDRKGLKIYIKLRRGYKASEVMNKLNMLTSLRIKVGYNIAVIINGRCVSLGIRELLDEWIKFRLDTICRLYGNRLEKEVNREELLTAWEKINMDIDKAVKVITDNVESNAVDKLMEEFSLTVEQAKYIMETRVKNLTRDNVNNKLSDLARSRKTIEQYREILGNEAVRKKIICKELEEIIQKYAKNRKTLIVEPLDFSKKVEKELVDDGIVKILITDKWNIKRLTSANDIKYYEPDDDVMKVIECRNNEDLLLFTDTGICYKLPIAKIDASRGKPKEYIYSLIEKNSADEKLVYVINSGGYEGDRKFNIVFDNARGRIVYLDKFAGNRSKYKNVFGDSEMYNKDRLFITEEEKFFLITKKKKAAYCDLSKFNRFGRKHAFKIARIDREDEIYGLQPLYKVPSKDTIDLEKYTRGYCIKIRSNEALW